jgi:transporter family protein
LQLYFFLAIAVLAWGLVSVLEKTIINDVRPIAFVFWRWVGLGICLIVLLISSGKMREVVTTPLWKTVAIAMSTGVISWLIAQFFFFKALELEQVSIVVPFTATFPLVTAIAAYFILREPLTLAKILGTVLIIGGSILLTYEVGKGG